MSRSRSSTAGARGTAQRLGRNWALVAAAVLGTIVVAITVGLRLQTGLAPAAAEPAGPPPPRWGVPVMAAAEAAPAPASFAQRISSLGSRFDGRVGIAVHSLGKGWTAAWSGGAKLPQQSLSKLWVALAVLDRVDAGELKLDDPVVVTKADLTIFHQPIRERIGPEGYRTTVYELLELAMTQSDNTANDVLARRAGGQAGVSAFLSRKRIGGIAMGPGEKELQTRAAGMAWDDSYSYGRTFWQAREQVPAEIRLRALTGYVAEPPDGASPAGYAHALARLRRGELVSAKSTAVLLDLMQRSTTGPERLRGGLAPGWTLAHKTGTGQVMGTYATAYNDAGLLTAPDGRQYAVVVMIGATYLPVPDRQDLMHQVIQATIDCAGTGAC